MPVDSRARSKNEVVELLDAIERHVAASPTDAFERLPDGHVRLHVKERTYAAGRFEVVSLATLAARIPKPEERAPAPIDLRGTALASDIGAMQATAPAGALFQAASQFNCLEAPGDHVVPVRNYPHDNTQGPRASVSAFPGTFLRHYFAPDAHGGRFVQTDERCIDLLADVLAPSVGRVRNGYLTSSSIRDVRAFAKALEDRFDQVRIGLHDDVEVVLGQDWGGIVPGAPNQRVAQVFTSTIALGGYSEDDGSSAMATVRRQLLRAAYLGTLLGAVALGKHSVVLTLIGGGAFANPHDDIWEAILFAIAQTELRASSDLDVVVNVRGDAVPAHVLDLISQRASLVIEPTDPAVSPKYNPRDKFFSDDDEVNQFVFTDENGNTIHPQSDKKKGSP